MGLFLASRNLDIGSPGPPVGVPPPPKPSEDDGWPAGGDIGSLRMGIPPGCNFGGDEGCATRVICLSSDELLPPDPPTAAPFPGATPILEDIDEGGIGFGWVVMDDVFVKLLDVLVLWYLFLFQ